MNQDRIASIIRRALPTLALACAAMLLSGCATGRDYEMGQRAERRGDAHLAYDSYCRAASQNPDNVVITSAIKRVGPKAADHWEKQGQMAMNQGHYADAWKSFMRVLEIRPDHPSAALVIRQLEQEHPTEVAYARQDYEQRGARSLVMSSDGGKSSGSPNEGRVQVAQGGSNQSGNSGDLGTEDDVYVSQSRVRNSPPPPPTAGKYGAVSGAGSAPAPIPYNPPVSGYSQDQTYEPTASMSHPDSGSVTPFTYDTPPETRVTADVGPPAGYMLVRTLSKKDRRYAQRREFVDGVAIRLDDVDDHDAKLELYMGSERVAKIKDIRINESAHFVGQTGRQFRLVVLDIHKSTETVRIGVSPL